MILASSYDLPFFSNLPRDLARALDRSVATEGFSAIIRVLDTAADLGIEIAGRKGIFFKEAIFSNHRARGVCDRQLSSGLFPAGQKYRRS